MRELLVVAEPAFWIGIGLAFSGHYDHVKQWLPLVWMYPYIVLRVIQKFRKLKRKSATRA